MIRKAAFIALAAAGVATQAPAFDIGIGDIGVSVDVGLDNGIGVDADIGIGGTEVGANVDVGAGGIGANAGVGGGPGGLGVDVAVGVGPGAGPGTGPGTNPGTNPGTTPGVQPDVAVPAGALVASGNYAGLVGRWLYSSDGERLGRITAFKGYDGQWLRLQVRLDPALGVGDREVVASVTPRTSWEDRVETRMSAFRFMRHLQQPI